MSPLQSHHPIADGASDRSLSIHASRTPSRRGGTRRASLLIASLLSASSSFAQDARHGAPYVLAGNLEHPVDAVAHDGHVLVLDALANTVLVAPIDAPEQTTWRSLFVSEESPLSRPLGMALDRERGLLYVADAGSNRVVRFRLDSSAGGDALSAALDGGFSPTIPAGGSGAATFSHPLDVAVQSSGAVWALDIGNSRVLRLDSAEASNWTVAAGDLPWERPGGLDVDADGTLWIADEGGHRILQVESDGAVTSWGHWGDRDDALRHPSDVAIDPKGQVLVADSHNHRVAVFDREGTLVRSLGSAPGLSRPERLSAEAGGQILLADSQNGWIVVWPGDREEAASGFDTWIRDSTWDDGEDRDPRILPSLSSPDVLVRRSPDLDLDRAQELGLDQLASEIPLVGEPNSLYFEIRNLGDRSMLDGVLTVWVSEPQVGAEADDVAYFPRPEWSATGFARWGESDGEAVGAHRLPIGFLPAADSSGPGRAIVGPLVWTPPFPTSADGPDPVGCEEEVFLLLRLFHGASPIPDGSTLTQLASNDVAVRKIPVVGRQCLPDPDRYEVNDEVPYAALLSEDWQHLSERCPRSDTRSPGEIYPDRLCPDVFENLSATRRAEEIWTLEVPDLSLHSPTDRDFYSIELPQLADPEWGLDDISPLGDRSLDFGRAPHEPEPMPECGAVRRVDPAPAGRDGTIWVNVSSELVVRAVPEANRVAREALTPDGEEIRVYRGGSSVEALGGPNPLERRIVCPQSVEELSDLQFSFGESFHSGVDAAIREPRSLGDLGGYSLELHYVSSIEREVPDWARSANDERGIRTVPCLLGSLRPEISGGIGGVLGFGVTQPSPIGARFPDCGPGLPNILDLLLEHPRTPGLPDCIADGPDCFELSSFAWAGGRLPFELGFLTDRALDVRLFDRSGQVIARSQPVQSSPNQLNDAEVEVELDRYLLSAGQLPAGTYYLGVRSTPGLIQVRFRQVPIDPSRL